LAWMVSLQGREPAAAGVELAVVFTRAERGGYGASRYNGGSGVERMSINWRARGGGVGWVGNMREPYMSLQRQKKHLIAPPICQVLLPCSSCHLRFSPELPNGARLVWQWARGFTTGRVRVWVWGSGLLRNSIAGDLRSVRPGEAGRPGSGEGCGRL
jgi:hypothetical protein